jgi:phospholipid/cholesterol/gamma-HCH transport system substrate-binding protein/paraquat-inducible protein B
MKPNYFKIGLFVIVAFILILTAIVVFGSGLFTEEKIYFETYFDGSVSGLNIGAPMELRGVRMGQVEKITFARNEYEMPIGSETYYKYGTYVIVLIAVDVENLPAMTLKEREENIKQLTSRGFRVRLASNLLTGLAYLQGEYLEPERYPVLEVPWEPKNLYVSSAPGAFTTLKESVDHILSKLEQIDTKRIGDLVEELLVSVNKAVDDANIPEISSGVQDLVADVDQAVKDINTSAIGEGVQSLVVNANQAIDDVNVPAISNEVQSLLVEARQTNQHLQELLKRPEKTDSQIANIAVMIANLNKTLMRLDKLVLTQTPKIEQTLENLREVSADIKELTGDLKQHPSELIFSQPPPKSEVSK